MGSFLDRIERQRLYMPPLDAGTLKYFAVIVMLVDHVTYGFLEVTGGPMGQALARTLPQGMLLDRIGRTIGRQAFPIFCFFLVEGFFHTRSRVKYLTRLGIFAALSQIPFQKCFFSRTSVLHLNVIGTLFIGFLAIWTIDEMKRLFLPDKDGENPEEALTSEIQADGTGAAEASLYSLPWARWGLFLIASAGTVAGFSRLAYVLHSDYRHGGVIMIVLMYCLRKYRITAMFISWAWLSWYNRFELYAAPAFLLLASYNGKRGRQNKYFFYFFYPVHLLLIWLIRMHFFGF